jgi:hypothetical protein
LRRTTELYAVQHYPKFGIPALGGFEYRERARDVHKILVKTHEGIKPCARPMRGWADKDKETALKIYSVCRANSCEHCLQSSVCIKEWEFPDQPGE